MRMTYPITLVLPAYNVGGVVAGQWRYINAKTQIKATCNDRFELAALFLGALPTEEIIERLRNENSRGS